MVPFRRVASSVLLGAISLLTACSVSVPVLDRDAALKVGSTRLERVSSGQEAVAAPLDLSDAIARALMYNLDYRAAAMMATMAREDVRRASYALWPDLALGAGYTARDEFAASVSEDPATGLQTLSPSVSSEKKMSTAQLQLSWNALDFGVGYLRAKQKANGMLIAEEERRKAFQTIVQEVTFAWWRALAAQRMEPRLAELRARVESALQRNKQMEEMHLAPQGMVLDYRRDLLLSLKRLGALEQEVRNARSNLLRLVALPAGANLALAEPADLQEPAWLPALNREQLQRIALANRPELREAKYRERMASLEGKVAIAALMPGLNLSLGPRYDSNKYLENNNWNEASAHFSFNLLNLAALPTASRYGKAAREAESLKADAMTVAVVSQLAIALQAIEKDRLGWCLSRELDRVAGERETQQRARAASAAGDELTRIRAEVEAVLAGLESAFSFAELQASHALLLNTLGVDPYPDDLAKDSPGVVASQLRSYFETGLKARLQQEADALGGAAAAGDDAGGAAAAGISAAPALRSFQEICTL